MKCVPNFIVPVNGIEWRDRHAGNSSVIHKIRLLYQSASKEHSSFLTFSRDRSTGNDSSSKTFPEMSIASFVPFEQNESLHIEDDTDTSITISFNAFERVNVKPDPDWYHSAYLNKVARLGSWLDGQTTEQVFGPSGFHSVVTGFVVVYRPSFTISTSSLYYDTVKRIITEGNQFTLGPFSFGTLNSPSEKDFTFESSDPEEVLTIQSEATYAQILGIVVQNPCGLLN